jgi:hypothetical protein
MPDASSTTDHRRHCRLECRKAFIRYAQTKPVGGVEALRICKENCDGQYRKRSGPRDGEKATSKEITMWTHEASIETTAPPERIWALFSDVAGWKNWNAGIEKIQLHGTFTKGATFFMQPPGEEGFTSTLVDIRENDSFVDETVIDGTCVLVHHKITRLPSGNTKITYRTEISGPAAAEFGPVVTGDFSDVLRALKVLAEESE